MPQPQNALFAIEIDYERGSENPSRIFRTMSELIEAFATLDDALIKSIDSNIQPIAIIEDVEVGSLRAWLAYVLRSVDDDALKNLDWKKAVGSYLVSGKYIILNYLENKTEITNRAELQSLEAELLLLAEETDIHHLPAYTPINKGSLLPGLQQVSRALSHLESGDKAKYKTRDKEVVMNAEFSIVPERIEELLTSQTIDSTNVAILKVKRPDYLGESQWEFRHGTHPVSAKILDVSWLKAFQERKVEVRPGDSLRVRLKTSAKYGYDYELVGEQHEIVEVIEVLPNLPIEQAWLLDPPV